MDVLTHLAVDHGFSTFVLWGVPTAPRLRMFIDEMPRRSRSGWRRCGLVRDIGLN